MISPGLAENSDNHRKKIIELISNSKNLVISSHINPDGDSVGSSLAILYYAQQKGVDAKILFDTNIPSNLKFLTENVDIIHFDPKKNSDIIENADTIVIVDLNDLSRLKTLKDSVSKSKAVKIVIDHHISSPKRFADYYYIDSEATSTGELIWEILQVDENFIVSSVIANALYVAIMTDSGCFRFPKTDSNTHRIIACLIEAGADPFKAYDEYYNRVSFNALRLLGTGYTNTESFFENKMLVMTLSKSDFLSTKATDDDVENFVESLLSVKGVKVGILISDVPDKEVIRISFRSKDDYDVRSIAAQFGGGGHINAAGARVFNAGLLATRERIIHASKKLFEK